jgi:hypothetical protein
LGLEEGEARAGESRGANEEKELGGHTEAVLIHWGRQSFNVSRTWIPLAPESESEKEFLLLGEENTKFNLWTERWCMRTD